MIYLHNNRIVRIIQGALKFGKMRHRKIKAEIESYHIANKSHWGTEKIYREADFFAKLNDDGGEDWWEKDELSDAE